MSEELGQKRVSLCMEKLINIHTEKERNTGKINEKVKNKQKFTDKSLILFGESESESDWEEEIKWNSETEWKKRSKT